MTFSSHKSSAHFAADAPSAEIEVQNHKELGEKNQLTIQEYVEAFCPSVKKEFKQAWWLPNGHAQTAYCVVGDFTKVDKVEYERKYLRLVDGGTIGLDFTPPQHDTVLSPETPIIVVKHGLTGGSYESYVRSILYPACKPVAEGGLGYRGVVCNFRGCAGVPLTSDQFYSAGHTEDLRTAVAYLRHKYPKARMIGIGFSLGASVMTRYLGQEGEASRICAGAVLGCPWNLTVNSYHLEGSAFNREVYSKAMGSNLMKLVQLHLPTIQTFPTPNRLTPYIDQLTDGKSRKLKDVDELLTSKLGGSVPPFPHESADAYYVWASSDQCLPGIKVPFLAINADDDPIVKKVPEGCASNPYVCIVITRGGGHLGWFQKTQDKAESELVSTTRWVREPVLEWVKAAAEDLAWSGPAEAERKVETVGEWWKEVGREEVVGWRELSDDEVEKLKPPVDGGLKQGL